LATRDNTTAILGGNMKTNDILESLNMAAVSAYPLPNELIHQIADALQERDEYKQLYEESHRSHSKTHVAMVDLVIERDQLRAETKSHHRLIDELRQERITLWEERDKLRAENKRLSATLRQIGQAVAPNATQLENWIAAQVDGALGEVVSDDRIDPLAPVVVS
jgi:chromosome segregation ATPase